MSDVWGPTSTRSSKGYYYYISFTDDTKRFSNVKFLVDKKGAVPRIKEHGGVGRVGCRRSRACRALGQ